jgi:hypothetical protein
MLVVFLIVYMQYNDFFLVRFLLYIGYISRSFQEQSLTLKSHCTIIIIIIIHRKPLNCYTINAPIGKKNCYISASRNYMQRNPSICGQKLRFQTRPMPAKGQDSICNIALKDSCCKYLPHKIERVIERKI